MISFNPWASSSWLKARFFDNPSENVLAMTTTYRNNEFLSDTDRELFEEIRRTEPERYKIVGLGKNLLSINVSKRGKPYPYIAVEAIPC